MKQKRLSMKFLLQVLAKFEHDQITPAKEVVLKFLNLVEKEMKI